MVNTGETLGWGLESEQESREPKKREIGSTSQSTKMQLKMSCDLYCDITLCLAIKTDLHLQAVDTIGNYSKELLA